MTTQGERRLLVERLRHFEKHGDPQRLIDDCHEAADRLAAAERLVEEWRLAGRPLSTGRGRTADAFRAGVSEAFCSCADELASVLTPTAGDKPDGV